MAIDYRNIGLVGFVNLFVLAAIVSRPSHLLHCSAGDCALMFGAILFIWTGAVEDVSVVFTVGGTPHVRKLRVSKEIRVPLLLVLRHDL